MYLMFNNVKNVEECDAIGFHSTTKARGIKRNTI